MKLFSNCTHSNLDFQLSFNSICQELIEIWLFEHEFQHRNFDQLRILGESKFSNKLLIKYLHFACIFGKVEIASFSKQLVHRSQEELSFKKIT